MSQLTATTLPWSSYKPCLSQPAEFPLMAERPCPLTGQPDETELFRIEDLQFYDDQNGRNRVLYRVVQSLTSGLIYTNPCFTPKGFEFLFAHAGSSYNIYGNAKAEKRLSWTMARLDTPLSRVLDVGCGMGNFLNALPGGIEKLGVDIDLPTIEQARAKHPHITFYNSDFSQVAVEGSLDLITMFAVLEHVPNPLETLRHLRALAHENTRLIVEVPLVDLLEGRPVQEIVGFLTAMHVTYFSRKTLADMLHWAGWEVIEAEDMPPRGYCVMAKPSCPQQTLAGVADSERLRAVMEAYIQGWRQNGQRINGVLSQITPGKNIVVWGAGMHTAYMERCTALFEPNRRYVIVDSDPLKAGTRYYGIPVMSPTAMEEFLGEDTPFQVVISTYGGQNQIADWLIQRGCPRPAITTLY